SPELSREAVEVRERAEDAEREEDESVVAEGWLEVVEDVGDRLGVSPPEPVLVRGKTGRLDRPPSRLDPAFDDVDPEVRDPLRGSELEIATGAARDLDEKREGREKMLENPALLLEELGDLRWEVRLVAEAVALEAAEEVPDLGRGPQLATGSCRRHSS